VNARCFFREKKRYTETNVTPIEYKKKNE